MKLAEALKQRKDLANEIGRVVKKMLQSLILQEGKKPLYNVDEKYAEYVARSEQLASLVSSINYTNNVTKIVPGTLSIAEGETTINEMLIRRLRLEKKLDLVKRIVENGEEQDLTSKEQVRFMSFVDVSKYDTKAEELLKQIQELDNKLQSMNWEVDLIEV
ncbi:hypothetical protein Cantr_07586 [Candida viswanathii]|uniref:Septicolysin n=1 Tax=Candida viswanathii TaxID=5486 RepID=A0A367XZU8_9ASCO|nr:hypothetical protein Cantr_07586 [Candida viswanathii]